MVIYVVDAAGETHEFVDAEKYATDEHNNLEIHGPTATVFNRSAWVRVGVDDAG